MRKLFVTINLGGYPVSSYDLDESWDLIAYTDSPHLYPEFTCIPISSIMSNAITSKRIKWALAKNHLEYDVVLYADSPYSINGGSLICFTQLNLWHENSNLDMALVHHPLSKSISDEVQLCKNNLRWSTNNEYWLHQMLFRDVDMIGTRNMYANGIMFFKPLKVQESFKKVFDQMEYCQRDQVVFPIVNPNTSNIYTLKWNLYNNSMFTYNTLR